VRSSLAVPTLIGAFSVVPRHKLVEVRLNLFDGTIEFLPKRHFVKLLLDSLVEFLNRSVGLWMPDFYPSVFYIIQMKEQFVTMAFRATAILWA
jgi:hypothetical protein